MERIQRAGPALRPPVGHRGRGPRAVRRRALQARADRPEGRRGTGADDESVEVGAGELTIYANVDRTTGRDGLAGPLPRPAPAEHRAAPQRLGAQPRRRRLLARLGEERAAAAHLRHRVADQGRAARAPAPPRGGREARPPQARRGARPVLLPRRDRLRPRGVPSEGRHHPPGDGEATRGAATREAGYSFVYSPHITKADLFQTSPATCSGTRTGCSRRCTWTRRSTPTARSSSRAGLLPEADELPVPHPDLSRRAAAATATCRCGCSSSAPSTGTRSRARCTGLTRVRGLTQDDAHLFVTPDQLRTSSTQHARVRARSAARLRARRLLPRAVDQGRRKPKCIGSDEFWETATDALAEVATESGLELVPRSRAAPRSTARRSRCRRRDAIGRTWQLSTMQIDFNLPERFDLEYTAADGSQAAARS